jgi:hypothetical protein
MKNEKITTSRVRFFSSFCNRVNPTCSPDDETRWNAIREDERRKLFRKDRSMRSPVWAALVYRISMCDWNSLSNVQRDGIAYLFSKGF